MTGVPKYLAPCTRKLPLSFYRRGNVVRVATELLGTRLVSRIGGVVTAGMIVETEAYGGVTDRACHAYGGRRTERTETMYRPGGVAYVYLCYGLHALLNVVTNRVGIPDAVLIRALEPVEGIEVMRERRGRAGAGHRLTSGPGTLTQALGITCELDGVALHGDRIWIERGDRKVHRSDVVARPRVGVAYAGEDARRPWRFYVKGNPWVSKQG